MDPQQTLMLVPAGSDVNLARTSLNMVRSLRANGISVSCFQPIKQKKSSKSKALDIEYVEDLLSRGLRNRLLEEIFDLCKDYAKDNEVLLIQGLQYLPNQSYARSLNVDIAKALDADVVVLANAKRKTPVELERQIEIVANAYQSNLKKRVISCVVNKVRDANNFPFLVDKSNYIITKKPKKQLKTNSLVAFNKDRPLFSATMFRYKIMEIAKAYNKRIVLPEGGDIRILGAAQACTERGLAKCVLLGNAEDIYQKAAENGVELNAQIEIIDPEMIRDDYIEPLMQLRKHKGMTKALARRSLQDDVVLGTMMIQSGVVDGMVAGAVATTANTIRPALQLIKTKPDASLVSAIFFMCLPEQVLVYGDCALNLDPDAEGLADIAIQTADSARMFGIEPKVAMISYGTGKSARGASVDKVRHAVDIVKTKRPDIIVDGPLQYDAAVAKNVAQQKAPNSVVGGEATVFIFPDLDAGNITYKAVQRSANILSIGPILQGLRKPVNDLSRGALVEDIFYTIVLTAVQAAHSSEPGLTS